MSSGFVTLHRKMKKWEWYTAPNMFHLFTHLLLSANYKTTRWRGETIERGQLLTGRKRLSLETGLSERKVRTCLKNLQKTGEILIRTTKLYSVITICNYSNYQDENVRVDQQNDQQNDQQATNRRPTGDQQATTSNKDNKVNKVNNIKKQAKKSSLQKPANFSESEFEDLISHRKGLKAPLTARALAGITKQFTLSGLSVSDCIDEMANRGWKGFKAEWVKKDGKNKNGRLGYVEPTAGKDYNA